MITHIMLGGLLNKVEDNKICENLPDCDICNKNDCLERVKEFRERLKK